MQKDSYCSVIASHNQRIIQPTSFSYGCNCRNRAESPLDNKCLTANIVYKRVVSAPSKPDKYFGIAETYLKIISETTQDIVNCSWSSQSSCL